MEQEKNKSAGGYTLIPDSIGGLPAKELSMIEKVLLCKIISLSKGRPCEMSNAAFASCFGVTGRRITEHIAKLKEKGWIDVTGPRTKRYIKPTEKAISLWMKTSIDETIYRRKRLETKPSSTIDGSVLNYRRNHPPKNIENIESIDICANGDLHTCAPSQKCKTEKEGQKAKEELFSTFWKAYPNGSDRKRAKQAFMQIKDVQTIFPEIMNGLKKEKAARERAEKQGSFFPSPKYAVRWLKGRCWEDDVEKAEAQPPASGPVIPTQADIEASERKKAADKEKRLAAYREKLRKERSNTP